MKQFFRFLTGEINGDYAIALHHHLNENISKPVKDLFMYIQSMKFKLEHEDIKEGETPIKEEDLLNIGRTAGLFLPFIKAESLKGSLKFVNGKQIYNGDNYSERGLLNRITENFQFFRTTQSPYDTDITTLTNKNRQASFVPKDAPILGYIGEGDIIYEEDGTLIESMILDSPPVDRAWYPYYGEKYLILAETFLLQSYLDIDLYKQILEIFQFLRYNGVSTYSFVEMTKILTADALIDCTLEQDDNILFYFRYRDNPNSTVSNKTARMLLWRSLVAQKFKTIVLEEIT